MDPNWRKPATDAEDPDIEKDDDAKKAAALAAAGGKDKTIGKDADKDKDKDMVSKPAMDAALKVHGDTIAKAVRETERGIRVALATVKPWVGELPATLAFDSAEGVHRQALTMLGVSGADKLHADALLPILQAQPKPGSQRAERTESTLAMDSSAISKAHAIAPGLANISQI
jgi:hypothetical protein